MKTRRTLLMTQAAMLPVLKPGEVPTGIEQVDMQSSTLNAPVYNMNGQRVQTARKGLYIQNGRKFIVR